MDKTVRGRSRTERGNTRGGATKKRGISRTLLSINLHLLVDYQHFRIDFTHARPPARICLAFRVVSPSLPLALKHCDPPTYTTSTSLTHDLMSITDASGKNSHSPMTRWQHKCHFESFRKCPISHAIGALGSHSQIRTLRSFNRARTLRNKRVTFMTIFVD